MSKTTTTLVMFCPQKGEHSGRPGESTNNVQLNAVRPNVLNPADKDPNAEVFSSPNGNITLSFNGITSDESGKYSAGKKFLVTIEPLE